MKRKILSLSVAVALSVASLMGAVPAKANTLTWCFTDAYGYRHCTVCSSFGCSEVIEL